MTVPSAAVLVCDPNAALKAGTPSKVPHQPLSMPCARGGEGGEPGARGGGPASRKRERRLTNINAPMDAKPVLRRTPLVTAGILTAKELSRGEVGAASVGGPGGDERRAEGKESGGDES